MFREPPNVYHVFRGGLAVRNGTANRRMQVRELIIALQDEIQQLSCDDALVEVTADIRISISQPEITNHSYRVRVHTVATLDDSTEDTSSGFLTAREHASDAELSGGSFGKVSDVALFSTGRRNAAHDPSTADARDTAPIASHIQSGAREDHAFQIPSERPKKRQRTGPDRGDLVIEPRRVRRSRSASTPHPQLSNSPEATQRPRSAFQSGATPFDTTPASDAMVVFLDSWRNYLGKWHSQGGWMFDHLTRLQAEDERQNEKLDSIQATIPALRNQITTEMTNMTQSVIPWLERCRKTSADASQAREEKWRTSSATFHDQARREREEAEKEILGEMKLQKSILDQQMKMINMLLESQGLLGHDTDEGDAGDRKLIV